MAMTFLSCSFTHTPDSAFPLQGQDARQALRRAPREAALPHIVAPQGPGPTGGDRSKQPTLVFLLAPWEE